MKWNDLPVEIQEKMLEEQVKQGNPRNPSVFIQAIYQNRMGGGFTWYESTDGAAFWGEIVEQDNIDVFFEKYPPENNYYGYKTYEAINVIEAWGCNFNTGNVLKYICRAGKKGDRKEDLQKALWYLQREINAIDDSKPQ
jgi:hypothetical protein